MAEQDRRCIVRRWLFGNVDNIVVNTIAACSVGRKLLPRWSQMHLGSLVSDAGQVRRKVIEPYRPYNEDIAGYL